MKLLSNLTFWVLLNHNYLKASDIAKKHEDKENKGLREKMGGFFAGLYGGVRTFAASPFKKNANFKTEVMTHEDLCSSVVEDSVGEHEAESLNDTNDDFCTALKMVGFLREQADLFNNSVEKARSVKSSKPIVYNPCIKKVERLTKTNLNLEDFGKPAEKKEVMTADYISRIRKSGSRIHKAYSELFESKKGDMVIKLNCVGETEEFWFKEIFEKFDAYTEAFVDNANWQETLEGLHRLYRGELEHESALAALKGAMLYLSLNHGDIGTLLTCRAEEFFNKEIGVNWDKLIKSGNNESFQNEKGEANVECSDYADEIQAFICYISLFDAKMMV